MHLCLRQLVLHPPQGYEFVIPNTSWDKPFLNSHFLSYTFNLYFLNRLIPVHLAKSYLDAFLKKPPKGTALTYSWGHLVFRKEPWVVELEWVHQLTGFRMDHLRRYHNLVERYLALAYCRKILCWSQLGKQTLLAHLDCAPFADKIEVVLPAVPPKTFTKTYNDNKVKLLFVGSDDIPGEFDVKGGKEVLEAFVILKQKYDHLELVVRSDIPHHLKAKYQGIPGLRFIEEIIPWHELEEEFKTADIFLLPSHNSPFSPVLDAMSYELPVIMTDVYANSELVEDGKTGLIVRGYEKERYHIQDLVPPEFTPQRRQAVNKLDHQVVADLVTKAIILIENKELRRQMGRAGRCEVEHGKFSIKKRNEQLKRIFDEATQWRS
jgi:glycosyltransferase involved in cell wall biosynthesis